MQLEVAKKLVASADEVGVELEVLEDYSGRGMFGKSTTAVEFNTVQDLFAAFYSLGMDDGQESEESGESEEINFSSLRIDSLGKSQIIY